MQITKLFAIAIAVLLLPMAIAVFQSARAQLVENSTTSAPSRQETVKSTAIASQSNTFLEQMSNFIQSCASRLQGGDMSVVSECAHVFAAFNDKMTQLFSEQKAFFDHILYGMPLR